MGKSTISMAIFPWDIARPILPSPSLHNVAGETRRRAASLAACSGRKAGNEENYGKIMV